MTINSQNKQTNKLKQTNEQKLSPVLSLRSELEEK